MNWSLLKRRLMPTSRGWTTRFRLPTSVLEIEPDFVVGARLEGSGRAPHRVRHVGVRQLSSAVLEPHANRANIVNGEELRRGIREVVDVIGNASGDFGLVVPDPVTRIGILSFEALPDDYQEAESLVRWRMRGILPFAPEEARLSFQVLSSEPSLVEVLAVAARASVLAEYETTLEPMNGGPLLILPVTLTLLPLLPDQEEAAQLLVHICCRCMTTVVVCGKRLCTWRTRELGPAPQEWPEEVAAEAARVMASARDHLGIAAEKAWLCARPTVTPELVSVLGRTVSCEVRTVAPHPELAAGLPPGERLLFEQYGAPVAGLVANAG